MFNKPYKTEYDLMLAYCFKVASKQISKFMKV